MKSTSLLLIVLILGLTFNVEARISLRDARSRKKSDHGVLSQIKMTGISGMYQGSFVIVSRNFGQVLDINGGSTGNGAGLIQYPTHGGNNQLFRLYQQADGYFVIQAVHSGKVLDVPGATKNVQQLQQYDFNGSDAQLWRLDAASADGSWGDWVFIRSKASNMVMDVNGASANAATAVIQFGQKGSGIDNQVWAFIEVSLDE